MMKLHNLTIKIIAPLALTAAGPLTKLLNEIADRERVEVETRIEQLRRDENYQCEAEYYAVPVETLQQLDRIGIPWRMVAVPKNNSLAVGHLKQGESHEPNFSQKRYV